MPNLARAPKAPYLSRQPDLRIWDRSSRVESDKHRYGIVGANRRGAIEAADQFAGPLIPNPANLRLLQKGPRTSRRERVLGHRRKPLFGDMYLSKPRQLLNQSVRVGGSPKYSSGEAQSTPLNAVGPPSSIPC